MKVEIIRSLGEDAVLLPRLIGEALSANDRIKLRLSLLQDAAARAERPSAVGAPSPASAGLGPGLDRLVSGAHAIGGTRFAAPGARTLLDGLAEDLRAMHAPLKAAAVGDFDERLTGLLASMPQARNDELDRSEIAALASARRAGPDSVHLLVMDLHKAINELAAATAVEEVDGARVLRLGDGDRDRVRAFMAGLRRTGHLAFGHPGLGTTAARSGDRLTIQNDIGETDAHVLVVHVDGLGAEVTYTDVHRHRAAFFMSLLGEEVVWTPLSEKEGQAFRDGRFFLVEGRYTATDLAALDRFLGLLASRIVFLIDWNKARRALEPFVERDAAIGLLRWAADHECGHRAFLVLGGADLVFEAVRRAAEGRVPFGARLAAALGERDTIAFLRRVLQAASAGLGAGRSTRLIRDEIQADLAQRFQSAEGAVLELLVTHLGLSLFLAGKAARILDDGGDDPDGRAAFAARAVALEAKADRITVAAREACARLRDPGPLQRAVDEAEQAMDALEEFAFLTSLPPAPAALAMGSLSELALIVIDGIRSLVRACEAAMRLSDGRRDDATTALEATDATALAERRADAAERAAIAAFMSAEGDPKAVMLGLEMARTLERATDFLSHSSYALRQRVLEDLSA